MAYDYGSNTIILFGGISYKAGIGGVGRNSETWILKVTESIELSTVIQSSSNVPSFQLYIVYCTFFLFFVIRKGKK
jgi:hypothetical protein